jgi:hypothetical protein
MSHPYAIAVDQGADRTLITIGDMDAEHVIVNIEPASVGDPIMMLRRAVESPTVFSPIPHPVVGLRAGSRGYGVTTRIGGHRMSLVRLVPMSAEVPAWKAADLVLWVAFALRSLV